MAQALDLGQQRERLARPALVVVLAMARRSELRRFFSAS